MIELKEVSKTFKIVDRKKGLRGAFLALFKRKYRYIKALDNISFKINEGEIVGYIGPNGAGKSTTIKIMSGILIPDSGLCEVQKFTPWKKRKEYVKEIGVVFGQRTQLWWDVPVIDSFELLKSIYSISDMEYEETLKTLTETLNLQDFLNVPLRQLSLGQRMRVELAAALLHSPKILFLDEPTIGLDAVSKIAVRQFIKKINAEKKITIILTTHDMHDIEALTDRIIFIGKGKILYDGSISKIKEEYEPYKILTVNYPPREDKIEVADAKLNSWNAERAEYFVDIKKTTVAKVLAKIGEKTDITNITLEGYPLESIIVRLYEDFKI